ncbi:hypothetical protein GWN42_18365, partial [candidate division KSB1 bacterium]|nr:hypothetical protein [candidate division KSB1 bacterium]
EHEWQGWWAKMELFRPDLPVDGRILYFDLDMIIVDNIEPLIASRYPMVICSAFGKQKKLNPRGYNSSVMSFDRSDLTKDIWKTFYRAPRIHIRKLRSDQDFIIKYFPYIHKYPDEWIRKLGECERNGRLVFPEGMKILLSMPLKNHMAVDTYPELRELWG